MMLSTRMVRVQNKLEKAAACLEYFTTRQWAFADENVQALCTSLSPEDRRFVIHHHQLETIVPGLERKRMGIRNLVSSFHSHYTIPTA